MSSYNNNNNENIVSTDISSPITDNNNNNMSELKSPKSLTPLIEQKLRNIAPAPQNKSEYDVYHIPKVSSCKSTKSCSSSSSSSSSWRKRKNNGHIPRPKNCFMAYREQIQHKVLEENPGMNNKLVSVIAAKMWNEESEETKQHWREQLAKTILNNNSNIVFNEPEDITVAFNNRTPPLLWSHYRSTSTDSISSWASDSSAPSTPPYIESNSPSLLPTTNCPSFKTPNYQNNYLHPHDFLEYSSSPLHYTNTANTNTTTSDDDWNKIISSFEDNFFDTLLPAMEFDQSMQIDDSTDKGNYYLDEGDDLEYNEFNEGFFNDPSSQLLNSFKKRKKPDDARLNNLMENTLSILEGL
ncbi:8981_t:CDS:2 [Diversispora eburnea]|uniref:8981_t:CDS:1 n=1 Tax=Diversispora eburnea TaxID=1213867 RepID=A0A9N9BBB3_9GLOM|nr:8981_t:CDS:2 [Diversispora eburnea]